MFYMLGHGGAGGRARPRTGDEDRFRGREATRPSPQLASIAAYVRLVTENSRSFVGDL
jgi:hypothetical protein